MQPLRFLLPLFAVALMSACSRTHYPTDQVWVPPLQKQGDICVTGDYFNSAFGGFAVAAAGSPVERTALAVRHINLKNNWQNNSFFGDEFRRGRSLYTEGAAGTYYPLSDRNTASLYAGFGQGQITSEYQDAILATLRYRRIFIQPGIYTAGRRMSFSSGLRLIRLRHYAGDIDARIPSDDLRIIRNLEQNTPNWIAEFGFSAGFRFPGIQLNAFLTQTTPGNPDLLFADTAIGLSATLSLQDIFGKKR